MERERERDSSDVRWKTVLVLEQERSKQEEDATIAKISYTSSP